MWCFRRMFEISWTDMVPNKRGSVKKNTREKNFVEGIVSRNEGMNGLDIRLRHDGFSGFIIEDCVEGKNYRRRPRLK